MTQSALTNRHDSPAIETTSFDLSLPVSSFATGWGAALTRTQKIDVVTTECTAEPPKTISFRLGCPAVKTYSYAFPELPEWRTEPTGKKSQTSKKSRPQADNHAGRTRLKPPTDIVKLEDRLYYMLQPPLETILSSESMHMPFEPFPYQYQGIAFLYPRFAAILADEMGLGKTMQAITSMRLLLRAGELRKVLLICPKPLVSNWKREFTMWAPEIPLCVIEGDQTRRHWQWRHQAAPLKIANYELLMRDRDVVLDSGLHFDLVVLDEAQRIKNRSSTTSQITRAISRSRSWALTGTPVENSSEDLVGIFEFLSPGYLQSGMTARRMAKAAGDYILRRTKEKVLTDLPPKLYRDAELDLTPDQWCSYKSAEEDGVIQLEGLGAELTIQHVFELVLRLKQICNFDPATGASSKLERLEADLEEVAASGRKAIVFSQWVGVLEKLRDRLRRFGTLEYHGKIPAKKRETVISQFKEDPSKHVILMSYGAGSVGLNLQFCRYVFLFDRWWNPAVEDQAINRAHRIGAAGSVTVNRMLTLGTIEERINQILEEKRALFEAILSQTAAPRSLGLSQDEVFGLFDLKSRRSDQRRAA
ncbi:MAG: DEAD/DEAH box helicase [Planctomycetota bacterium]|nr:DEAD/DEAH box helicase [Planctomycetota bacterium]